MLIIFNLQDFNETHFWKQEVDTVKFAPNPVCMTTAKTYASAYVCVCIQGVKKVENYNTFSLKLIETHV